VRTDYIVAGAIVAVAALGLALYMRSRSTQAAARVEAQKRLGPVEHGECDSDRLFIAQKSAELANTPDFDPVRRGNLTGEITLRRAALAECERQATRRELLG
jgi:hypothetical protein